MWNIFKQIISISSDSAPLVVESAPVLERCPLAFFEDSNLNEILLDGCRAMWLVSAGGRTRLTSPFADTGALSSWIIALARSANVRLDPIVGAAGGVLHDGALRWHCLLAPMAVDGPIVSIRRHRFNDLTLDDFKMPKALLGRLINAVEQRDHIVIAGPTGSGKTSLLAALLKHVPADERVFLMESVPEIGALTGNIVRLSARQANIEQLGGFALDRLLTESLRLLPDRLIVGEVRSTEAAVLIDAMRAGHSGVMSTMHAASAREVLDRLTSMASLSASDWAKDLSAPVLVVSMVRGSPPQVSRLEPL